MRLLRATEHRRMAWLNGGGETIEIHVQPPDADLSDFGWRVSMARVDRNGPFSVFRGIDRTLCLLGGSEIVLDIAGIGERTLRVGDDPLRFPADAPTKARLGDGPVLDLNVMTRRGVFDHRVRRVAIEDRCTIRPGAGWTLLVPLGPVAIEETSGKVHGLEAQDALMLTRSDPNVSVSAHGARTAILIEIGAADLPWQAAATSPTLKAGRPDD